MAAALRTHADGALCCPCGTNRRPINWRSGSKSYLYRLRCPVCGRKGSPAHTDFAKLTSIWNDTVRPELMQRREPKP